MLPVIILTIRSFPRKAKKSSEAMMTMMGLDLVEKEALMMYHTQKGLKESQNFWLMVSLIVMSQVIMISDLGSLINFLLLIICKALPFFLI